MNKLIELISELKNDLNSRDEANRQVKVGNVLRDIYEESRKQSQALQSFSTDLAITISAGFEQILNNEDKGVLNELKLLRKEIETLGTKLNDPATEMTQNVVNDLQNAMKDMIGEFQASVSGSTKSEMERLAALLGQAGSSLTDFLPNFKA